MSENLKKLIEEVKTNGELKEKLSALTDRDTAVEKTIEIAKEYGIELTEEDFRATEGEEALSADELTAMSGGYGCIIIGDDDYQDQKSNCGCIVIGAASKCGCVIIGTN